MESKVEVVGNKFEKCDEERAVVYDALVGVEITQSGNEYAEGYVWLLNSHELNKIDPESGEYETFYGNRGYSPFMNPRGLTWDVGYLWTRQRTCEMWGDPKVYRLEILKDSL